MVKPVCDKISADIFLQSIAFKCVDFIFSVIFDTKAVKVFGHSSIFTLLKYLKGVKYIVLKS